ncbi:hypothetical protein DFH06DRAFT_1466322 [Mycena polygramma]|nr:hypothetical protein DFH06DRAFT_1466322 [Mycena polygramma]
MRARRSTGPSAQASRLRSYSSLSRASVILATPRLRLQQLRLTHAPKAIGAKLAFPSTYLLSGVNSDEPNVVWKRRKVAKCREPYRAYVHSSTLKLLKSWPRSRAQERGRRGLGHHRFGGSPSWCATPPIVSRSWTPPIYSVSSSEEKDEYWLSSQSCRLLRPAPVDGPQCVIRMALVNALDLKKL